MNQRIKTFIDSHGPSLYGLNWQFYLNEDKAAAMTEEVLAMALQGLLGPREEFLSESARPQPQQKDELKVRLKLFKSAYQIFERSPSVGPTLASGRSHWGRLGAFERSALFLKHKHSLSYADMAIVYQVSPGHLISTVHQSRSFLLEGRSDIC